MTELPSLNVQMTLGTSRFAAAKMNEERYLLLSSLGKGNLHGPILLRHVGKSTSEQSYHTWRSTPHIN